jgi:glucose/mannose transport system substrate-binding protein
VVLAQRLLSGNPPDVWQTFPGGALQAFVNQRQVADVSSVISKTGMATTLPKVILDGLTVDGKQYGVPTSSHRGNVLFYNTKLLTKAGVAKPDSGYSVGNADRKHGHPEEGRHYAAVSGCQRSVYYGRSV